MRFVVLSKTEFVMLSACVQKTTIHLDDILGWHASISKGSGPNSANAANVIMRRLALKLASIQVKLERISGRGRGAKAQYKLAESDVEFCRFLLSQQGMKMQKLVTKN
jgi:hypothetical protein